MKALMVLLVAMSSGASGTEAPGASPGESLHATVAALDSAVFDAFNRCSDPAQLERHAGYFADDVEFYHDTGGVTWTREEMLANTRKYVCGNFSRELVPGTLQVHPIKDFGAISQGSHRFCQFAGGKCEGLADFTMIWRYKDGAWQVTRVLSYGHRTADGGS
ncbi:nuclear transport factor 2 family protein [Lysobacter olei]